MAARKRGLRFRREWTRRGKRRAFVVLTSAALGLSVPLWVPRLLAPLPAFQVAEVQVRGTRYVPPGDVLRLAAIGPDASVWDDEDAWEDRVAAHAMIQFAEVRRTGMRTLEIRVVEDEPIALVATPELTAVNEEGQAMPLDPVEAALDLPLIAGRATLEAGRVEPAEHRVLIEVLGALAAHDPGFGAQISELGYAPDGGYEITMMPSARVGTVFLPAADPILGFKRVSLALGDLDGGRAEKADARYENQVVVKLERKNG